LTITISIGGGLPVSWGRDFWWPAALVAATLVLIAPLWCVTTPPMPDYPAHLATFYLIGGGAQNPILARFYRIQWIFAPNLASEMIVPWLAQLTGLTGAIRLFLSAGVAMWVLGAGAIQRALYGRHGLAPLLGAFFAYNANFSWGFFNYYFAAGLSLALFAAWIATDGKAGVRRTLLFTLAVSILYFCHLFAVASLALMIGCFETARLVTAPGFNLRALGQRALNVGVMFVPAALAFLFLRPAGIADGKLEFNLADTMLDRFESLIVYHFDAPAYALPIALLAFLALAIALRRAVIAPSMWGVLAALLLGALLAPEWAMGGWAVHLRLPGFFCILLFATTRFKLDRRFAIPIAAATLLLMAWIAGAMTQNWRGYDRQFAEFRAALSDIPPGSRLLTVLDGDPLGQISDQPYWHMAEYAIADRQAMTALLFTTRGQHVVRVNPPYDRFVAVTAQQGSPPDIGELDDLEAGQAGGDTDIRDVFPYLKYFPCHYDEVVVVRVNDKPSPAPDMLRLRHAGSFFSLYDVKPYDDQARVCGR
jgi:hypothetical protein